MNGEAIQFVIKDVRVLETLILLKKLYLSLSVETDGIGQTRNSWSQLIPSPSI